MVGILCQVIIMLREKNDKFDFMITKGNHNHI